MKPSAKTRAKDLLPTQPVLEELAFLRRNFREIVSHYSTMIESEIAQVTALVTTESESKEAHPDRARELRDMLMMLRELEIKTSKGRRRDLKKIESLLAELRTIAERW